MAWLGVAIAVLVLSALLFGESVTPAKVVGVTLPGVLTVGVNTAASRSAVTSAADNPGPMV